MLQAFTVGFGFLNLVAWFGPESLRHWGHKIFAILGFGILFALLLGALAVERVVLTVRCSFGNQEMCLLKQDLTLFTIKYTVEGWTTERLNAERIRVNAGLNTEYFKIKERRWSLLRQAWYKGEEVTTRQLCVTNNAAVPDTDLFMRCFERVVATGQHNGEYYTSRFEHPNPTTPEEIKRRYDAMMERWQAAIW